MHRNKCNPLPAQGGHSQTEVVPMLVRAPQNWTLNGVIPGVKSTPKWRREMYNLPLNGVGQLKSNPFSQKRRRLD